MNPETRACQNCKQNFVIADEDYLFYKKLDVPPPTWCPECRMIRRMCWRDEHVLYKRPDNRTGKIIFSAYSEKSGINVWDHNDWWSDGWDPMVYGQEIDWSRPFLTQIRELMQVVPWCGRMAINPVNSDYCHDCGEFKNCFYCFTGQRNEDCSYTTNSSLNKDCLELNEVRESELCYEDFFCIKSYRVFFSCYIENSQDIWFSRNLTGCTNCFGCVSLRNKSYCWYNEQLSPEEYRERLAGFSSNSYRTVTELKREAQGFWLKHPVRAVEGRRSVDVTGNYFTNARDCKNSFYVLDSEHNKYCYKLSRSTDTMDFTVWGSSSNQCYECSTSGRQNERIRFCFYCYPACRDLEYCLECHTTADCFGCVGLRDKRFCILNRQYSEEEYRKLRSRIVVQMKDLPYRDAKGRVYAYGEFYPPEFSPYGYNETLAHEYFPLTQTEAEERGFRWIEPDNKDYQITLQPGSLPDNIRDVPDSITQEIIACEHATDSWQGAYGQCNQHCVTAFRIVPMELAFYRHIGLPLPRLCINCRHYERLKLRTPVKLWQRRCQCQEARSDPRYAEGSSEARERRARSAYRNTTKHSHGNKPCPNEFETSYSPDRPEIVYCESCYNAEVA
ncbi:MAG: hypothetical protein HY978_02670 [Candidatus Liptonbacteria bacterium]|nr:hypothetical protein [Candidatus Liptonbacteria bacterium]